MEYGRQCDENNNHHHPPSKPCPARQEQSPLCSLATAGVGAVRAAAVVL